MHGAAGKVRQGIKPLGEFGFVASGSAAMYRLWVCVLGVVLVSASISQAQEFEVGKPAPSFKLPGSDGKTYSLADFKGKKAVVIAWFPKAFTGG
jgi:peroxiredoxin Q/BCP